MDIQHLYQEYAFLPEPSEAEGWSETEPGAYSIMANIIARTYESPYKWYMVVFKPFNKPYALDPDWYAFKGLSKCRDMFKKPQAVVLTREVNAEKIHVNAIVCTDQALLHRHDRAYCNKYKIYVVELPQQRDRQNALSYISKEAKTRTFKKYMDYIAYSTT